MNTKRTKTKRLPKKLENPLEKALAQKLDALTDPRLGPLTDRRLKDIYTTAMLGQRLLALDGPMRLDPGYSILPTGDSDQYDEAAEGVMPVPNPYPYPTPSLASSSTSETFASNMMREIVAAISSITKKPEPVPDASSLVFAISLARNKGMEGLAKSLEDRLLAQAAAPSGVGTAAPLARPALPKPKKTSNGKAKHP